VLKAHDSSADSSINSFRDCSLFTTVLLLLCLVVVVDIHAPAALSTVQGLMVLGMATLLSPFV
jgi:hypothetical protein